MADKDIMDENIVWQRKALTQKTAESLRKNNFTVYVEDGREAAIKRILALVKPGESAAFGGSFTIKALGLKEALEKHGARVVGASLPAMGKEESARARRAALSADVYIASPNAVTMDGKLLFVDKIGNRAAAMIFGPARVIAVTGWNKIVENETDARRRVRNLAGPANARRLGVNTPCAEAGVCQDCASPERICNIAVTLLKKPSYTDYHVILIPEELGY